MRLGFGWLFLSSGVLLSEGPENDQGPWELGHSRKMAGPWWNCIEVVLRSVANFRSDSCGCRGFVGWMSSGTNLVGHCVGLLVVDFVEDQKCSRPLGVT